MGYGEWLEKVYSLLEERGVDTEDIRMEHDVILSDVEPDTVESLMRCYVDCETVRFTWPGMKRAVH